jgi:Rad3-related DNA helicase
MKPVLCYIPPPPQGLTAPKGVWVKERVAYALEQGLAPALLPSVGLERLPIALPAAMATAVSNLAEAHSVAPGRMVGMLLQAWMDTQREPAQSGDRAALGHSAIDRPEQAQALERALPLIHQGKLVLMEAGTGVGKSRIAGRIAQKLLAQEARETAPEAVVLTTPTVNQCVHLCKEVIRLQEALAKAGDTNPPPNPSLLLGRAHFIDFDAAMEVAMASAIQPLTEWLDRGAPAGRTDNTKALGEIIPGIAGLMEDWRALVSAHADESIQELAMDCELTEESSEASANWYETLRSEAMSAKFVVCTHAMVAVDAITRARGHQGILPASPHLIIDEAHQFEQEVANMASQGVSLLTLSGVLKGEKWAALRVKATADQAYSLTRELNKSLGQLPMKSGSAIVVPDSLRNDPALASAWSQASVVMRDLVDALRTLASAISKAKDIAGWKIAQVRISQAARALDFALAGTHTAEVSLSKQLRMATIQVGPRTVSHYLKPLWDRLPSATLMSATLYLPTLQGDSAAYITQTLSLPQDRVAQTPSMHPDWATNSAALWLPTGNALEALRPPTGDEATHEDMIAWIANVARVIATKVTADAAGGTLVLMSSYDRLDYLYDELQKVIPDRLIIQPRTGHGLSSAVQAFRTLHSQGRRPVLLATGGAWTGLDLRDASIPDEQAQLDLLLTDVVIPNIPFGLNRTTTHTSRVSRLFSFEASATALLLRQGLGRLVRRPGLLHRRIWLLDSRLIKQPDGKRTSSAYSQCLLMVEKYLNRQKFTM